MKKVKFLLKKYEDLESFVAKLDGREYKFIKHRTTPGIYIIDLREKPEKKYEQLGFDFESGYE